MIKIGQEKYFTTEKMVYNFAEYAYKNLIKRIPRCSASGLNENSF